MPQHRRHLVLRLLAGLAIAGALAPALAAQTLLAQPQQPLGSGLGGLLTGASITPVGDLDGDGCTDLAVGGPGLGNSSNSDCVLLSGRTLSPLGKLVPPPLAGLAQFGVTLDAPGDTDADGLPDILVGAPGGVDCNPFVGCTGSTRGAASLHSGASFAALHTWEGAAEGDFLGFDVASLGDVDGDGVSDVALGAPQRTLASSSTGAGYVRLHSGATGAFLRELTGVASGDGFGWEVAGPGDVDGDGEVDLLVRAPWAAGQVPGGGSVSLYRASDGAPLRSWGGESATEDFGHIAGAGDVDADGLPDLLIGAPRHNGPAGAEAGIARVYSGVTGAVLLTLDGHVKDARLGISLCGLGDLDGDGYGELLVGADPAAGFGKPKPYARLFSGLGAQIYFIDDVPAMAGAFFAQFGRLVAPAGDTNGDGLADFVLSGPTEVIVGGDVIHIHGGQHVLTFSGLPLAVTSLPNPGTPGVSGIPALSGDGSTAANQILTLHLEQAAPAAPTLLVLGIEIKSKTLNGVKLWPSPLHFGPVGLTDVQGALQWSGRWPPGVAYGTPLFAQALVLDATAPTGLAASNTLQLTGK